MLKHAYTNKMVADSFHLIESFRAVELFKKINSRALNGQYDITEEVTSWDYSLIEEVVEYLENNKYSTKRYKRGTDIELLSITWC